MLVSSGADLQLRALKARVLVKGREMGLGLDVTHHSAEASNLGPTSW